MTNITDIDFFLKGDPQSAQPVLLPSSHTASGNAEIKFNLEVGGEVRGYKAEHFFDILEGYYSNRLSATEDNFQKIHIARNGRYVMGHFADVVTDWMKSAPSPKESYDFQSLLNRSDYYIKCLQEHIDINKSAMEYRKLKREVEFWKDPRWYGGLFTGAIAAFVGLAGIYFAYLKCK